jgi:hypothetical protein
LLPLRLNYKKEEAVIEINEPRTVASLHGDVCTNEFIYCIHCKKNPIYVFPEMKLRGLVPNFYIHVSVSDFYIPRICLPICPQQKKADRSWEYINHSQIHECGNWETGHYNYVLEIKRLCSFISGNT